MKRPLAIFAIILCSGIFTGRYIRTPFLLIYMLAAALLAAALFSFRKGRIFNIFLSGFIFFFAVALWKDSWVLPRCHVARFVSYKNSTPYTLKGVIVNPPLLRGNTLSFIFKTEAVQSGASNYNSCGNILVHLCPGPKDFHYGQELLLRGNLRRPFGRAGPRGQSYRDYLYNQYIFSVMRVKGASSVVRLREGRGFILARMAFGIRDRVEGIIFKRLSFVPAGILEAMILGEKKGIPSIIYGSMMKSGTVHILVVSGFNVALVAFIIVLSLKLLRVPRKARFFVAAPLIIIYCLITGASTPVLRATIMAIVLMFASLVKREPDIYNSLSLAAILILIVNPRQLFDIGFQLSFASVISIICIYPRLRAFVPEKILSVKCLRLLCEGSLVSFSAWLGTALLIARYFRIITPVTVPANILIVPLASLITLSGFGLIAMEFISPPLAYLFAYGCEFIVALLLNINAFLIKLPGAHFYL